VGIAFITLVALAGLNVKCVRREKRLADSRPVDGVVPRSLQNDRVYRRTGASRDLERGRRVEEAVLSVDRAIVR
jgi:hypothetical protein